MRPPTGQTAQPGKYTVRFGFGVPFQGTEMTVLDTDYQEYALIYACTNSILPKLFHTEFLWIMSRDGALSNPTRQNLYELLDGHKINRVSLQLSARSQCPQNTTTFNRESDQNLAQDVDPVVLDNSPPAPSSATSLESPPSPPVLSQPEIQISTNSELQDKTEVKEVKDGDVAVDAEPKSESQASSQVHKQ